MKTRWRIRDRDQRTRLGQRIPQIRSYRAIGNWPGDLACRELIERRQVEPVAGNDFGDILLIRRAEPLARHGRRPPGLLEQTHLPVENQNQACRYAELT